MSTEKIMDRVRKLLAKANDAACTPAEAEIFLAKAHELMAQHNIDMAKLTPANSTPDRTILEFQTLVRPWNNAIIKGICDIYFCKWYYKTMPKGKKNPVYVIGRKDNAEVAHSLCLSVLRSVQIAGAGQGRSFLNGASSKIWQRCQEIKQGATASANPNSTALVVIYDNEQQANNDYLASQRPELKLVPVKRHARAFNAGAYARGVEHGSRVTLTPTINPTAPKRLQ